MTYQELYAHAVKCLKLSLTARATFVVPKGTQFPRKFPRGYLLCENSEGEKVYSFDPIKMLLWLREHKASELHPLTDVDSHE